MKKNGKCRNCERWTYTPQFFDPKPHWPYIFCSGCYKPAWMCDCWDSKMERNPSCTEWWEKVKRIYLPGVTYDRL